MKTPKRTLGKSTMGRRAEALAVVCLLACLGALGLRAATQTTTFDPAAATVGNARLLAFAITQYVQDSDEKLPPTQSVAVFQKAMRPYVPDPAVFVSRVTGQPFVPNPALSGLAIPSFSDPYTVAVFQDTAAIATVGFLDGHIERGGVTVGDTPDNSYYNAKTLSVGVIQYTQDNDERFPPMKTQVQFQTALLPYVHNLTLFVDPANNKPFVPNPALSEISLANINDPRTTILLESAPPYHNGIPTIAYVDGHVTPVTTSRVGTSISAGDASNLKQLGLATIQYTQDYDERYPITTNYTTFEDQLLPYTKNTSLFFSPGSGLPYILNPALSGLSLAELTDPAQTEEARDAQLNPDGTLNHLEADGHVRPDLYFVPKALVVTPDDSTHLFWPAASQQAATWTLLLGGSEKDIDTQSTSFLNDSNNALAFSVGADGQTRILWHRGYFTSPYELPITGSITLDTLGTDGSLENSTQFGPYDGWTALFLTTGPDNTSRLLWQKYDGTLALWTLSPEGDFTGSVTVPTLKGGTPVGLALGADGLTRLLWKTAYGDATIWTVAENGQVVRSFGIPSPPHYTLTGLGLGFDGASRFLWGDGQGHAAVLTLTAGGGFEGYVTFGLPGGGMASQIGVGKAGDLRVLWEASDGGGQLQTLTAAGKQTSVQSLTPYLAVGH